MKWVVKNSLNVWKSAIELLGNLAEFTHQNVVNDSILHMFIKFSNDQND